MKVSFWRLAAACLLLVGLIVAKTPQPLAADLTLTTCQTFADETKLANQYGWAEVKTLTGAELALFLTKYNAEPPITSLNADSVHFFKKEGVSQTGIVFVLDGCVIKREFMSPFMVEKLLGSAL